MIVTTTEYIAGYDITEMLGLVDGSTVRAKNLGKDIMALFKNIVGGEIQEYKDMLDDARLEALNRAINNAKDLGADAIIGVRYMTSFIMQGAAEIFCYGTAVRITKKQIK